MNNKKIIMILSMFLIMGSAYLLFEDYQSVASNQDGITGLVVGTASVEIRATAQISMPVSSVSFGTMAPGGISETSNNSPPPFKIQNDGTVKVNVTIQRDSSSVPLFNGTGGGDNSASFQFAANETAAEPGSFDTTTSIMTWTNAPGTTPIEFLKILKHSTAKDEAEVELKITVPEDETPGIKTESLAFIAYQS